MGPSSREEILSCCVEEIVFRAPLMGFTKVAIMKIRKYGEITVVDRDRGARKLVNNASHEAEFKRWNTRGERCGGAAKWTGATDATGAPEVMKWKDKGAQWILAGARETGFQSYCADGSLSAYWILAGAYAGEHPVEEAESCDRELGKKRAPRGCETLS